MSASFSIIATNDKLEPISASRLSAMAVLFLSNPT
jgi:hypothetical protein